MLFFILEKKLPGVTVKYALDCAKPTSLNSLTWYIPVSLLNVFLILKRQFVLVVSIKKSSDDCIWKPSLYQITSHFGFAAYSTDKVYGFPSTTLQGSNCLVIFGAKRLSACFWCLCAGFNKGKRSKIWRSGETSTLLNREIKNFSID